MNAGELVKELVLNFGVMVTLIYLTLAIDRRMPYTEHVKRARMMVAMAVVAGWITMVLAVRIGMLTFDLRFLPGVLVAFYTRRPWVVASVFALIAPARFYQGFNRPGGIVNTCGSACFRRPPFQLIRSVPSPPTG